MEDKKPIVFSNSLEVAKDGVEVKSFRLKFVAVKEGYTIYGHVYPLEYSEGRALTVTKATWEVCQITSNNSSDIPDSVVETIAETCAREYSEIACKVLTQRLSKMDGLAVIQEEKPEERKTYKKKKKKAVMEAKRLRNKTA